MLVAYLLVGAILFVLGLIGFVTRRNLIIMFLCTELMFQGIVVNLVALGRYPLSGRAACAQSKRCRLFIGFDHIPVVPFEHVCSSGIT